MQIGPRELAANLIDLEFYLGKIKLYEALPQNREALTRNHEALPRGHEALPLVV